MVDLAIITVTNDEYEAVSKEMGLAFLQPRPGEPANIYAWQHGFVTHSVVKDRRFEVVLGLCGRQTNATSAVVARATIQRFRPRYLVLCGIAGGFPRDKCTFGDVVVSKVIYLYQYGNIQGAKFRPRHDYVYPCDQGLIATSQAYKAEWDRTNEFKAKVLFGAVASGESLVDEVSDGFFSDVLAVWPTLQAVEMEGAGAAIAVADAQADSIMVGFIMIRGITDMPKGHPKALTIDPKAKQVADEGSPLNSDAAVSGLTAQQQQSADRDHWTKISARSAASFLHGWLRTTWPVVSIAESTAIAERDSSDKVKGVLDGARSLLEGVRERLFLSEAVDFAALHGRVRDLCDSFRVELPSLPIEIRAQAQVSLRAIELQSRAAQIEAPLRHVVEMLGHVAELEQLMRR